MNTQTPPEVAATNSPADAVPMGSAQPAPPQFVTINTALILCLITSVLTLMIGFYAPQMAAKRGITMPGYSGSKVVYLDFEKVLSAGIKHSMNSDRLGVADIQKDADKFQSDMNAAIQKYADSGYIVINNKALISASPTQDITRDVIGSLGIK